MILHTTDYRAIWIYGDDDIARNSLCKKLVNELKYNGLQYVYHNYDFLKKHFTCADKMNAIACYLNAFIDTGLNTHIVVNAKIDNEEFIDEHKRIKFVEVNDYDDIEVKAYNIIENLLG